MSILGDAQAAFTAIADEGKTYVKVGNRNRVKCLVPSGLDIDPEESAGRTTSTTRATVVVSSADFGKPPQPEELATLEYGSESYSLSVSSEDTIGLTTLGALIQFTISN